MSARAGRVLMVGIDAAEPTLVDSLLRRGRLPTLARLRQQGRTGLLDSPARWYSGAVWPTFYTGQRVPWHGLYHNKLWHPSRMCCEVPDERRFTARPFWEAPSMATLRKCVVDVPLIRGHPRPINGLYLNGWATHDVAPLVSHPAGLQRELRRLVGARAMPAEAYGRQDARGLLQLSGELRQTNAQLHRLGTQLLGREEWDFACIIVGTTHRAGHYLWDLDQTRDAASLAPAQRATLLGAVEALYEDADHALGELLRVAGADTRVLVFSLHGMGPNGGWSDVVPDLLQAWRAARGGRAVRTGSLYRVREALVGIARPMLRHVPPSLAAQLVPLWSARMFDWSRTESFPLPMDLTAMLRINLAGRERLGIVTPGADYERCCRELESFFHSLRDAASGQPLVRDIVRPYELAPLEAPHRDGQPDVLVRWNALRTSAVPVVESSLLPGFRFEVPRWLTSGRSGNHLPTGWFVATGPGVTAGATAATADILDLAPTARSLLGLEPDPSLHGRVLPLLEPA